MDKSTPSFTEFDPRHIKFQSKVINDIDTNLDYSIGTHELLFSGSVGSAKSLLAAHIIVKHCLKHTRAKVGIGRRSLPDIKTTLFALIVEHLEDELLNEHIESITYNTAQVRFKNGSMIEAISWADKKYKKFRSRTYSMFCFEEAVENTGDDVQAFTEARQRVGRLPHIKQNLILYLTNPDSPAHVLYKYFFETVSPTRHVYMSLTEQNPFLPRTYIEQLKRDLSPKEALRMLYGQWVEIDTERIYYAYSSEVNFKKQIYNINPYLSISLSFDFNIGIGKPMSCVISQYDKQKDEFHFFDEIVIHGSRTETILEEIAARNILETAHAFEIHGDATGAARSTASKWSNYDIIDQFLANYKTKTGLKLNYQLLVPKSNPPIKERHNVVNAYCENMKAERRLFVYEKAKTLHEGMKLTALKKGAEYIEDDSKEWQHSTTALGYRVCYTVRNKVIVKAGNI